MMHGQKNIKSILVICWFFLLLR